MVTRNHQPKPIAPPHSLRWLFGDRLWSVIKSPAHCLAISRRRPAQPLRSELNHGCTQMNTDKTDSESVSIRVHPWLKSPAIFSTCKCRRTVFIRQNPLTNHELGFALHGVCLRSAQSVGKNILRSKLARVARPIFRCGCTPRKVQESQKAEGGRKKEEGRRKKSKGPRARNPKEIRNPRAEGRRAG
jgi:hypothetical protein